MPPLKPGTISPTPGEELAINAGIATDPDSYQLSAAEFAQLLPVKRGRPLKLDAKKAIKLRLDPDVIEGFRVQGSGWQRRINEALRAALGLRR